MNWLSSNWIWIALGAGALVLFASGRGGCGMGHGGHGHGRREEAGQNEPPRESSVTRPSTLTAKLGADQTAAQPSDHVHAAAPLTGAALTTQHAGHEIAAGASLPRRERHSCCS